MTQRALVALTAGAIVGLALACGQPTGPGKLPTPVPVTVVLLSIAGPDVIAPGETVSFTATGVLSNRQTEDETHKVAWSVFPATSVLTIEAGTGRATAQASGDVTIQAAYQGGVSCCQARITRTVLPRNTYRLTGRVSESGYSVQGATVAVLSGIGAGLSTKTDSGGEYRLYGVAGTIQIKFSKAGYDDIVKTFTATRNDLLDFPDAHQTAIPSLAGPYALTLTADPACPTIPTKGIAPLPDEFRQARSYAASLTQDGPVLAVILTGPEVVPTQNRFTGHINPDGIEFTIGDGYFYYPGYFGIAERLSTTQEFQFQGVLRAQRNGSTIGGSLNGALDMLTEPANVVVALCVATNSQVMLTRAAQPSRSR